jgi:hypothetical protein
VTNEDEKRIADYMGWYWSKDDGIYFYDWDGQRPRYLNLNDAGLVVHEMQKRGEWVYFYDDLLDTYNGLCEDGKVSCGAENFSAWLFNAENFFLAFCEWRKGK